DRSRQGRICFRAGDRTLIVAALIAGVGWRTTFVYIGGGAAIVLFSAAMLMRYPASGKGASSTQGTVISGLGLSDAKSSVIFRAMCLIQFLFFATLVTVPLHLAPHGMDMGLSTTQAASLLSLVGAASILGRLGVGVLIDKIGCRNAMSICLVVLIGALGGFTLATSHPALFAVTAVYGIAHGALFVVVSPMVAYYFGMRAHGGLFGIVLFFGTLGGSVGPIATGATFDSLGSYTPAFLALAVSSMVALILVRKLPKEQQFSS
ncbi:MAG: MFS transporter, partial [Paracoccaceae bacterium]|nr:MFS transporter [Paracoccaceae bacterium]